MHKTQSKKAKQLLGVNFLAVFALTDLKSPPDQTILPHGEYHKPQSLPPIISFDSGHCRVSCLDQMKIIFTSQLHTT